MKVLITGNLGYVGPIVSKHLKDKLDAKIIGYDNGYFISSTFDSDPSPESGILDFQYYKDIRDIKKSHLADTDAIIHLSAISNDPIGKKFEDATYQINLEASKKIYDLACQSNIKRFVLSLIHI